MENLYMCCVTVLCHCWAWEKSSLKSWDIVDVKTSDYIGDRRKFCSKLCVVNNRDRCFAILIVLLRLWIWFKDDVVLALTTTGTVKVWTLLGHENRNSEPLYEHESKQIACLNALAMTCCPCNQRTVLIVCSKYWQVWTN